MTRQHLTAIYLGLCLTLSAVACDFSVEDDVIGGVDVGGGVVTRFIGGAEQGYLTSNGLFNFMGSVSAVGPSGELRWTVTVPGGIGELMRAPNGVIYAGTSDRVVGITPDGRLTGFDGAGRGYLAWHPFGLPMVYGQDGIVVLDLEGNPTLEGFVGKEVHAVAADPAGYLYILVTTTLQDTPEVVLYKTDARFSPIWWAVIDEPSTAALLRDVAVVDDFVVASYGNGTEARDTDGAPLWRVTNAAGSVLIDTDHTTYIAGSREAAIARDGSILWDYNRRARMTMTDAGLGAMLMLPNAIGTLLPNLALLDRRTGEVLTATPWEPLTDFVAPVVIGGGLVGAGHRIETSQSFGPGGDISVSQASILFVDGGLSAAPSRASWPEPGGPGGSRAAPFVSTQPTATDLHGLWLASDGTARRVISFASEAIAFSLTDAPAYGIWDYDSRERPRLVQVGTWSYDGERVSLTPTHDLTGGAGRTSLRVTPAPPGGLRMDDPLQDVTRVFMRIGRLPPASSGQDERPHLDALFGQRGPSDRNGLRLIAPVPDSDDSWVVMAYDYQGTLAGTRFIGSNIRTVNGQVTGNLFNEVVARLTPEGEMPYHFHNDTPDLAAIRAIAPEGSDGLRLYGPFTVGADTPRWLHSALLRPQGDALVLTEEAPWFEPDDKGRAFSAEALAPLTAPASGAVYAGRWDDHPSRERGVSVVLRADPDGTVRWQTPFGEEGAPVRFHGVTADEGAVYVLGTFSVPLTLDGKAHDSRGVDRTFIARLDAGTGAVETFRPLGQGGLVIHWSGGGRLPSARMAPHPDGGFVVVGAPEGRFATGRGTLAREFEGTGFVVARFGADLETHWMRALTTPNLASRVQVRDLAVDARGYVLLAGATEGTFFVDGVASGGPGRYAPLLELTPCGDLMAPRYFRARANADALALDGGGRARLAGGYMSDVVEPPFIFPFEGKMPTPSSPSGGTNSLLMTLDRPGRAAVEWGPYCGLDPAPTPRLRVSLEGLGAGRVVSEPPGIDCPGTCEAPFDELTAVRLIATPGAGSSFAGLSRGPFAAASCAGTAPCEVLMVEDTLTTAYFEAARLTAVTPMTLNAVTRFAAEGDRVAISDTRKVIVAAAGEVVTELTFTGQGTIAGLAVSEAGETALAVWGGFRQQLAEGGPGERLGLALLEADGTLRWARALQAPSNGSQASLAFHDGELALAWRVDGAVVVEDLALDPTTTALGRFDKTSGEPLALIAIDAAPVSVGSTPAGELWVRGGSALDGLAEPLPGVSLPGAGGAWFLTFDSDLALLDAWRWSGQRLPVPSVDWVDSGSGGLWHHYLDDALWPRFGVQLGRSGTLLQYGAQGSGMLVLSDVSLSGSGKPVWDPEAVRLSLQALQAGASPAGAWVTPAEDAVELFGLAASGRVAYAVVRARALRDAEGAVIWAASGSNPETALIAVEFQEVAR